MTTNSFIEKYFKSEEISLKIEYSEKQSMIINRLVFPENKNTKQH